LPRWTALVLSGFAQQNIPASAASTQGKAELQAELCSLAKLAQKIAAVPTNEEKARGWLELNRHSRKFGEEMNSAFPGTSIKGDKISPAEAQNLAVLATT
jgi:hypothetical protein